MATTTKYGFKPGDVAVVTDGANTCRLLQITDDSSPDVRTLSYATGSYTNYYDGLTKPTRWNSTAASMPAISAGNIYSMGPSPRHNVWSVDTTTTTLGFVNRMSDVNISQFFGVAEGVVDMKAQYGYDADGDRQISNAEWTKAAPADWTRVRAIRVALLVRSRDFEKPPTDPSAPTYRATHRSGRRAPSR